MSQTALGLVSGDILGIAVVSADEVVVYTAVAVCSDVVDEDLTYLAGKLYACLASGPEGLTCIGRTIYVGPADLSWPGRSHDLLYLANVPETVGE